MKTILLGLGLFTCSTLLHAETPAGRSQTMTSSDQVPEGLAKSDLTSIRAAYEAGRHAFQPVEGGWQARNPGQQWITKFDGRGFVAHPRDSAWQWGLELKSYGFSEQQTEVGGTPAVKADGQRLTYDWNDTVQEWFVNDTRGLEHGFTVRQRPVSSTESPSSKLSFIMGVRGGLIPHVTSDALGVQFVDENGANVLIYSGLKVWDADGKILTSHFESASLTSVRMLVDEHGARYPLTIDPVAQQAYLKASNSGAGDEFGSSVSISGDTVVVGARAESSSTTGVNSTPNESAIGSGAAYVFVRSGTNWSQQAYLKASNTGAFDQFGYSVSVSGDTLIVGAVVEDSSTTGVNSAPNESASNSGAAYVFARSGTSWSQQAYLKASNTGATDNFGSSVSISGDTLIVGANLEDSSTTGVNSAPNESASSSGAAYVFLRSGTTWNQQAYLKASNTGATDNFGYSVSVSGDTIVVGAYQEDSSTTGVNSTPNDSASSSGASYVFLRSGTTWNQQAYLKASNAITFDYFGSSVSVSGDTLIVGAYGRSTGLIGGNGNGAAYIFVRLGTTWSQQTFLTASNKGTDDFFGNSVSISGDTAVVGAKYEDSSTTGVNSTPNESATDSGAAYLFTGLGPMTVTTPTSAAITTTTAMLGGNVTTDGDATVTERGVIYSITSANANPLIGGSGVTKVAGTGTTGGFTVNVNGLSASTAYSFKAYATNSVGTAYTPVATFTTKTNADLAALSLSGGTLSPAFASGTTSYAATVSTSSITITPTLLNSAATVKVNAVTVASGTASGAIPLTFGSNVITTVVTAPGGSPTKTYTITVTRSDPPTDITLSETSIAENVSANTVVGTLAAIDPDAGDTFGYSLTSGTGSTDNAAFTIAGNALKINSTPDYEAKNSYSIRVMTTDLAGLFYQKVFTITITNVNEAPVLQLPASPWFAEATSTSGAVVNFSAGGADPEQGTLAATCVPPSGSSFPLGDTTVNVTVTDSGSLNATGSFLVRVRDTTAPAIVPSPNVTSVAAGSGGAVVHYAAASATDALGVSSLTYSHASGSTFPIGQTTVTITAKDAAQNTRTATFTVRVIDSSSGTFAGNLSVDGTLSASPAAGSLLVNGALSLQPTATTLVDLAGTSQGSTYDSITATGTVTLAGALQISFLSGFENTIANSNSFTILTGSSVTGNFSGLANNSRITLPNELGSLKITYNATNVVLSDWQPVIRDLTWDPGTTDAGNQIFNVPASNVGGRFYFRITSQATAIGAWRTVLRVTGGTADVYLKQNTFPVSVADYGYKSDRAGTMGDGFVIPGTAFGAAQTWYLMVVGSANSQWSLVSGEAFVQNLGTLASDATSSSGNVQIGSEGYRFFKTSTPPAAAAWRVWLNDGAATPATLTGIKLAVRRTTVPFIDAAYDHQQLGHMLLVPPYLNTGGDTYFLAVAGTPGTAINLDSRSATVTDVAFGSSTAFTLPTAGFAVYRTQVPVDQIGWQTELRGVSANVDLAVRRDNAASEWFNDAFSEVPGIVGDSVTLVPPTLTNGTYYMTIYNSGATAAGTLVNRVPFSAVPDDVAFIGTSRNDEPSTSSDDANPNKVGWRYFRVGVADAQGISEQLGKIGWELALGGAPANAEIALRRNFLPGKWVSRNAFAGGGQNSTYYQDFSSATGLLARPGHQADIWYIGVYAPATAAGNFSLARTEIVPQSLAFADGSFPTAAQAPGTIRYFTVNIPADPELLGWDLRTLDATGPIEIQARLGRPPTNDGISNLNGGTYWTHSNTSAGAVNHNRYLHKAVQSAGQPNNWERWLAPGTYYVGVKNTGTTAVSYSLRSRGIGTVSSSYPVKSKPLGFANGTATITDLPARECAYFTITVPAGAKTWSLKAAPSGTSEMSLAISRGLLPTEEAIYYNQIDREGVILRSAGEDVFYESRASATDTVNLPAGIYQVAVISAGTSPPNADTVGTGTASAVLTSVSDLPVVALGSGADVAGTPFTASVNVNARELKLYSFNVAAGTLSVEIRLSEKLGTSSMLISKGAFPSIWSAYLGYSGGPFSVGGSSPTSGGQARDLATLVNPAPGLYTVTVASGGGTSASATLSALANVPQPLAFADGSVPTAAQAPGTIRYFTVNIPADPELLGWDLRTLDATGPLQLQARLGSPPANDGNSNLNGGTYWTHSNTSAGSVNHNRYLHKAVQTVADPPYSGSRWLGPGLYYIGVKNTGTTAVSYSLRSRGIGSASSNYPVKSQPLGFANGTATITDLPARECAYFTMTVPAGAKTWSLKVTPSGTSEMSLAIRRGSLPTEEAIYYNQIDREGVILRSAGEDVFYESRASATDTVNLPAGIYQVAVISAGTSPLDASSVGTGTASAALTSVSDLPVTALGGGADVTGTPQTAPVSLNRRELELYSFNVAPGTLSVEVRLTDKVGGSSMAIAQGSYPTFNSGGVNAVVASGGAQPTSGGQASDLATLVNPAPGLYTVAVMIAETTNATATLSVVANVPQPLAFADGSVPTAAQAPGTIRYFTVNIPADPELLGWDLRTLDATGPIEIQARLGRPPANDGISNLNGGTYWTHSNTSAGAVNHNRYLHKAVQSAGQPNNWERWLAPGTYYVGVKNTGTTAVSYSFRSRGIGTVSSSYPVKSQPLGFANGTATITDLPARECAYFTVTVPAGAKTWSLKVAPSGAGEMSLAISRGLLPTEEAIYYNQIGREGVILRNAGEDVFYESRASATDIVNLPAGIYQVAVISAGTSPLDANSVGTGTASAALTSVSDLPVTALGGGADVTGTPQTAPVSLNRRELELYSFNVDPGTLSVEVRLTDKVGGSSMAIAQGSYPTFNSGGVNAVVASGGAQPTSGGQASDLATLVNPAPGLYTVAVTAGTTNATATLSVAAKPPVVLNFSSAQNGSGGTNVDTTATPVTDGARNYYQITVPVTLNGTAPLGWKLGVTTTQGAASLYVHRNASNLSSPLAQTAQRSLILAPPVFSPGTYLVEVRATGATSYTLTSEAVVPRNAATPWLLPTAAAYTTANDVGDSGQLDLANGDYDFYAVTVPEGNAGVLRTVIEAISGNPDLYIRRISIPSHNHTVQGLDPDQTVNEIAYSRALTNPTGTEYGNWVPYLQKAETQLRPGTYYLAVHAASNTNLRYRLRVSPGAIQSLALDGGNVSNQLLTGGDWRYYKVELPVDATMPQSWQLIFAQSSGDAIMFLRDTVPPGLNNASTVGTYGDATMDWQREAKNANTTQYSRYDNPGSYTLTTPPLRPGTSYYVGVYAKNDSSFSLTSSKSGNIEATTPLDFYTGTVATSIPGNSSVVYRISAPPEATRLKWTSSHASTVQLRLEQGTLPASSGTSQHYYSSGANSSQNAALATTWPWLPNQNYYLRIVNNAATAATVSLAMDGGTAYSEWAVGFFTAPQLANPAISGMTADPDRDGIANLMESLLGGNPNLPGTTMLPTVTTTQVSGGHTMVFRYNRKLAATGVTQVVEHSTNLSSTWAPAIHGQNGVTLTTSPVDATTEQVTVTIPSTTASRFVRLKATR